MTCLEAQSNIMAFIEKKLPDDVVTDFVRHMKTCKNCREELEIYYTLIIGMHQLDSNQELSANFAKDLDNELNRLEHRAKQAKRFKFSTFSVIFAVCVMGLFVLYDRCLDKVYNIEQQMKQDAQGQTYFYDAFGQNMDLCLQDLVADTQEAHKPRESTFYEKLREYQQQQQEKEDAEVEE